MDTRVVISFFLLLSCCVQSGAGKSLEEESQKEVPLDDDALDLDESEVLYEEDNEQLGRQKRIFEGNEYLLSSPHDTLRISLVIGAPGNQRAKRLSFKMENFMWTHRIPYVIEFQDPSRRMRLRKVLDHIESKLCVNFISVEGKIDSSDKTWPKEHGFKTNAYLKFVNGHGCVSHYGQGSGKHPRNVSPCYTYLSMMHETLHAVGALHDQKMPNREKYITVHEDAVLEKKRQQYRKAPAYRVNSAFFDSASNLLYGRTFFHNSIKPTYDFLRPDMGHLSGIKSTKTLFFEMNENYKCKETFCPGLTKDCGQGYLTFLHDECVCVCPDQYNPDTNCTTLIEKVEGPKEWPNTPFTIFKEGECPDGFQEGTIPISGKFAPIETGPALPVEGKTINIGVCTKPTPTENITWTDWPLGLVCIGKVAGVDCGLPFVNSEFQMKTTHPHPLKGAVGDVTLNGRELTMRFCCYKGAPEGLPMRLPTSKSFRLLKTSSQCQEIKDMFHVETTIETRTKTKIVGFRPSHKIIHNHFTHTSCLYVPPSYGCNKILTLSSSQRMVQFSIPKKGLSREGGKRCFYAFQTPPKTRLRLTFDKFSIHPGDRFYVKRYHPWTNPYRVLSDSRPTQIITERNYLFVEFWSHYEENNKYEGADLTVDLLFDDEMCYDADLQGSDYAGEKSVTELYDECLSWKDTTTCRAFPWDHSLTLLNSGNKCRNLDTVEMLQPWCYVKMRGIDCVRRYCDVCNDAKPKDVSEDCGKVIATNSSACSDTAFRNICFESCGASTDPYDKNNVYCWRPKSQHSAVTFQGTLQDSYKVGSKVGVSCGSQGSHDIECTPHGWTLFDSKCAEEYCIDASHSCQNTIENFPNFCTDENTAKIAKDNCKKSCGFCKS